MGPSSSKSEAFDQRVAATDQAKVLQGNSRLMETGAGAVSNTGTYNSGISIPDAKGNVTVTTSDPKVLKQALDAMSNLSQTTASGNSALLSGVLDSMSKLTSTEQTGGASVAASTITKILLGALALVVVGLVVVMLYGRKGGVSLR